jgi:hypothetical protein
MDVFEYPCVLATGEIVVVIAASRREDVSKAVLEDQGVS